jgi:hypothetical protein
MADYDVGRLLLARSPRFQALLDKSRQSIKAGKGLSRAEFWQAVKQRNHKQENQKPVRGSSGLGRDS